MSQSSPSNSEWDCFNSIHILSLYIGRLEDNGWYPELVFTSVLLSNSTNLEVVILNSSVLQIYFVK